MKSSVKERLKHYLNTNKIKQTDFCKNISVSNGFISGMRESIQPDKLKSIAIKYPDLDIKWLLTGIEYIPSSTPDLIGEKIKGSIPYYADLPISAGQSGLSRTAQKEKPTGYMSIPNVAAESIFPVIGYSMLPKIKPGDIIGVNQVHRWERVEPDKIYMVVTNEERMLKRLRVDNEDENILWCVSDNYKEFKIYKNEIINIFHVVYHGELL